MILKIYLKDDFKIGPQSTPYLKPENSPGPLTEHSTGTLVVLLDYLASSLYFTWVNPTNRKFEERALYRAAELDETGRYAYKATIFPIMTVGLARQDSAFSMVSFREGEKLSPYIKIPVVRSIYPEQTEIPPTAVDEINTEINNIKQDIHEITAGQPISGGIHYGNEPPTSSYVKTWIKPFEEIELPNALNTFFSGFMPLPDENIGQEEEHTYFEESIVNEEEPIILDIPRVEQYSPVPPMAFLEENYNILPLPMSSEENPDYTGYVVPPLKEEPATSYVILPIPNEQTKPVGVMVEEIKTFDQAAILPLPNQEVIVLPLPII